MPARKSKGRNIDIKDDARAKDQEEYLDYLIEFGSFSAEDDYHQFLMEKRIEREEKRNKIADTEGAETVETGTIAARNKQIEQAASEAESENNENGNNELDIIVSGNLNRQEKQSFDESSSYEDEFEESKTLGGRSYRGKDEDGEGDSHSYTSYWYTYPNPPSHCQTCFATRTHISIFEWRENYPFIILAFGLSLLAVGLGVMFHRVLKGKSMSRGYGSGCDRFCLFDNPCVRNDDGSFHCQCKPGYAGERCQYHKPCEVHGICKNGGNCIDLHVPYKSMDTKMYECKCPPSFSGANCQNPEIDDCASVPCHNRGECVDKFNDYECHCHIGYAGRNCLTVTPCISTPCKNGGKCTYKGDIYRCECSVGTGGKNCEKDTLNSCNSAPCKNGGTCLDKIKGYECSCLPNYSGKRCEVEEMKCDKKWNLEDGRWKMKKNGYEIYIQGRNLSENSIFDRNWNDYKIGFKKPGSGFWYGLEKIHQKISTSGTYNWQVTLYFICEDQVRCVKYNNFRIDGEEEEYKLHIGKEIGLSGIKKNIDNLLQYHNNLPFSTFDRDNDVSSGYNSCAENWGGGWWYKDCFALNPNSKTTMTSSKAFSDIVCYTTYMIMENGNH